MANRQFAEKDVVLECVQGKNAENNPVFAYVLLPKKKLASLHQALEREDVDLTKYGLIVATGAGVKPSAEFERQLISWLKKD